MLPLEALVTYQLRAVTELHAIADVVKDLGLLPKLPEDACIDRLIGFPPSVDTIDRGPKGQYWDWYGEQAVYEGSEYNVIRESMRILNPNAQDVAYDLGSGYGRWCVWGALTTPARFKGIELFAHRVAVAQSVQKKYGIKNLAFRAGNVTESAYDDGTVFYMFNPFSPTTMRRVVRSLAEVASQHRIRIAAYWMQEDNPLFCQAWLEEIYHGKSRFKPLHIFESR